MRYQSLYSAVMGNSKLVYFNSNGMNLQTLPTLHLSVLSGAFHWAEKALKLHFWTFDFFSKIKKHWNLKSWFLKTVHQRVSWGKIWAMCQNSRCREILNALRQELLKAFPATFGVPFWYLLTALHIHDPASM